MRGGDVRRQRIFLHLVAAFLFSWAVLVAGAVQAAEPRVDQGVDHGMMCYGTSKETCR